MSFNFDKDNNIWASADHVYNTFKEQILYNRNIFSRAEVFNIGENYVTYDFGHTLDNEGKGNFVNTFLVGITFNDDKSMFNFWIEVRQDTPFISGYFKQLNYDEILLLLYDLGLYDKSEQIWMARNYFIDHHSDIIEDGNEEVQ